MLGLQIIYFCDWRDDSSRAASACFLEGCQLFLRYLTAFNFQAHILGHAVMDIVPVAAVPVERLEIESVICHRDIPPIPDKKEYLTYLKENARKECAAKIGLYLYDSGFLVEKEGERLGDLTLRFRLLAARENPEEGIDQETYQRIVDGAMPVWGYRYE